MQAFGDKVPLSEVKAALKAEKLNEAEGFTFADFQEALCRQRTLAQEQDALIAPPARRKNIIGLDLEVSELLPLSSTVS